MDDVDGLDVNYFTTFVAESREMTKKRETCLVDLPRRSFRPIIAAARCLSLCCVYEVQFVNTESNNADLWLSDMALGMCETPRRLATSNRRMTIAAIGHSARHASIFISWISILSTDGGLAIVDATRKGNRFPVTTFGLMTPSSQKSVVSSIGCLDKDDPDMDCCAEPHALSLR